MQRIAPGNAIVLLKRFGRFFKSKSFGLWCSVLLCYNTNMSEAHAASIRLHGRLKRWYPTTNTTLQHNPEDLDSKHHRRESLKSRILTICF